MPVFKQHGIEFQVDRHIIQFLEYHTLLTSNSISKFNFKTFQLPSNTSTAANPASGEYLIISNNISLQSVCAENTQTPLGISKEHSMGDGEKEGRKTLTWNARMIS